MALVETFRELCHGHMPAFQVVHEDDSEGILSKVSQGTVSKNSAATHSGLATTSEVCRSRFPPTLWWRGVFKRQGLPPNAMPVRRAAAFRPVTRTAHIHGSSSTTDA